MHAIDLVQLRTRGQDYFSSVARPTDDDLIWPANSKEREPAPEPLPESQDRMRTATGYDPPSWEEGVLSPMGTDDPTHLMGYDAEKKPAGIGCELMKEAFRGGGIRAGAYSGSETGWGVPRREALGSRRARGGGVQCLTAGEQGCTSGPCTVSVWCWCSVGLEDAAGCPRRVQAAPAVAAALAAAAPDA